MTFFFFFPFYFSYSVSQVIEIFPLGTTKIPIKKGFSELQSLQKTISLFHEFEDPFLDGLIAFNTK